MDTTAAATKANGLATYLAVATSPTAAFTQLARTPMWGWAAIAGVALMLVATFLSMPEQMKIAHIQQQLAFAQLSADQRAQATQNSALTESITKTFISMVGFIAPWIIWLVSALVFTLGAAISGAGSRFSLAWVAALNASAVAFLGAVVNAVILALRGPDAISAPLDAYALPSPAMLVHGGPKLMTFLNSYNVVNVWFYAVSVIALERMLNVKRPAAVVTVLVYSLLTAGIAATFAR